MTNSIVSTATGFGSLQGHHQGRHFLVDFVDTLVRRRDYATLKANYPQLANCSEDLMRMNADTAWKKIKSMFAHPFAHFDYDKFDSILEVLKSPYWRPSQESNSIRTDFLEAFKSPLQTDDSFLKDFIDSIDLGLKQGKNMASICQSRFCGKSRILKETLNHVIGFYFNFDPKNDTYPWSVPHITEKFIHQYMKQCPIQMYRGLLFVLREWLESHSFSNYKDVVAKWNAYQTSDLYLESIVRTIDEYESISEVNTVIKFYERIYSEDFLLSEEFDETIDLLRKWDDGSTKKPDNLDMIFVFDEANQMTKIIGGEGRFWKGYKEVLDSLKKELSVYIIIEGAWGPHLYYGREPEPPKTCL